MSVTRLLVTGVVLCTTLPVVVLLLAAIHNSLPPRQQQPAGWIKGESTEYVPKPQPFFYHDPLSTYRRQQQGIYDLIDGRDETSFRHSVLVILTLGSATLSTHNNLANIQPAFIAGHRHAVVCDQGTVVGHHFGTFILQDGFQVRYTLLPTNCITESTGYVVTAYPSVAAELPELTQAETAWALYAIALMCALISLKLAPFLTITILTIATAYMAVWALMYGAYMLTVLFLAHLLYSLKSRVVTVFSDPCPFEVNQLKDRFRKLTNNKEALPGQHVRLAAWRRILEKEVANIFREKHMRFRDVGGARARFPEDADIKHICSAQNDNDDIIRQDKAHPTFDNCFRKGQDCPYLTGHERITGALLSHVDYHVTPEQLSRIINGPTFIITHGFGAAGSSGGFGEIRHEDGSVSHEAEWVNNAGRITMTTFDGTPYSHGYNKWETEGTIIGSRSAASYVTLMDYKDCKVIFAYPSCGQYDRTNPRVLQRATATVVRLGDGTEVAMKLEKLQDRIVSQFVYKTESRGDVTVPAHLPPSIAMALCASPRDAKYEATLNSLTSAKLRAHSPSMELNADLVKAHARMLANVYSWEIVSNSSYHGWDPTSDGYIRSLAYEVADRFRFGNVTYQKIMNDILNSEKVLPIAKILGVVSKVPTAEVFAELTIAEISKSVAEKSFRGKPASADAGANVGVEHGAAQDCPERDSLTGETSPQPSSYAKSVDNGSLDTLKPGNTAGLDQPHPVADEPKPSTSGSRQDDGRESENHRSQRLGASSPRPEQEGQESTLAPAINRRGIFFLRMFQLASSKGVQLLTQRHPQRQIDEQPRTVFRVELLGEEWTGDSEEFTLPRAMLDHELTSLKSMLCKLPRLPHAKLRCAIRLCVRAMGIPMSSCGHIDHTTDCFNIRVLKIGRDDPIPRGYSRITVLGVDYALPNGSESRLDEGPRGSILAGPIPAGCCHKMLPKSGNERQNDRSEEHQPEIGSAPLNPRTSNFSDRTRSRKTDKSQPASRPQKRNDHARKGTRSHRKGRVAKRPA